MPFLNEQSTTSLMLSSLKLIILLLIITSVGSTTAHAYSVDVTENQVPASDLPVINVWYENTLQFGLLGNPQNQVNILGNVYDPDGSIRSLSYRLNTGSSVSIPIGTSNIRLARVGDFNISINRSALRNGSNTVTITAQDNAGDRADKTITFNYNPSSVWPLPYSTNWAGAGNIHTQAQVVDGMWQLTGGGVQPVQVGYDRLIAIGDISWSDYEILVPITIYRFYPVGTDLGGVGLIARWQGHYGPDPLPTGWSQLGAYGYYSNRLGALALRLNDTNPFTQNFSLQLGRTYMFKLKAETASQGGRYSLKVWERGTAEPLWTDSRFQNIVNRLDTDNDLVRGSILLVAHRADAVFGDVTICPPNVSYPLNLQPVGNGSVVSTPARSNYQCGEGVSLQAVPRSGSSFVRWSGDVSSTSNPLHINVTRTMNIQAVFTQGQPVEMNNKFYIPILIR